MSKTFIIKSQEHLDNLFKILQEEFDRGKGIAVGTGIREIKFIKSRDIFQSDIYYAPNIFDKIDPEQLPSTAIFADADTDDKDLILGIWASSAIKQEDA